MRLVKWVPRSRFTENTKRSFHIHEVGVSAFSKTRAYFTKLMSSKIFKCKAEPCSTSSPVLHTFFPSRSWRKILPRDLSCLSRLHSVYDVMSVTENTRKHNQTVHDEMIQRWFHVFFSENHGSRSLTKIMIHEKKATILDKMNKKLRALWIKN